MTALIWFLIAAAPVPEWVPARWFSSDAASLALLNNSPVNCLLIDAESLRPAFIRAARDRGLAVLAVAGKDVAELPPGISAVVFEGDQSKRTRELARNAGVSVLELRDRLLLDDSNPRFIGSRQGFWPGIRMDESGISAGATSTPYINTNGGFLRYLRSKSPAEIWMGNTPPAGEMATLAAYRRAIADSYLNGARWILALDDDFARRLLANEPKAAANWHEINELLRYLEKHREWRQFKPWGRLCVALDGEMARLSGGVLDMLASMHLPATPAMHADCAGTIALSARTAGDSGHQVYPPPPGWHFPPAEEGAFTLSDRQAAALTVVRDMIRTDVTYRDFGLRVFNAAGALSSMAISGEGTRILLHLVNYTDFSQEDIVLRVSTEWEPVALFRPGEPAVRPETDRGESHFQIHIDRIRSFATIEFRRR